MPSHMFNDSDIKALFRSCAPQTSSLSLLPQPPPYFELLSGSGVILECTARDEVEKRIICNGDEKQARTTVFQIAAELSLDSWTVERLLPLHREGWGRIGASTIVTTGEYKLLEEALRKDLQDAVVLASDFCCHKEIDLELFRKLLSSAVGETGWLWIGHDKAWVSSTAFYEAKERELEQLLRDCRRPTKISALFPHAGLPTPFLLKVVSGLIKSRELKGRTDGTLYVPEVYIKERQDSLIEELKRDGIIAAAVLREEGVAEPEVFVRENVPASRLLEGHFVTSDFVAHVEGLVLSNIEQYGWSDVKDPGLRLTTRDEKVLRRVVLEDLPELSEVADRIVSKSLESKLVDSALQFAIQQAEATCKRRSKDRPLSKVLKQQDLLKYLSTANSSISPAIISSFMGKIYLQASAKFMEHIRQLKESEINAAKTAFLDLHYIRFKIHYSAVLSISDTSLRSKLAAALWENIGTLFSPDALKKLEVAMQEHDNIDLQYLQQIKMMLEKDSTNSEETLKKLDGTIMAMFAAVKIQYPSDEMIKQKKTQMLRDMNSTVLQSAKDPSLALLSTLIIIHAAKRPGILNITGKYVPKLLKELQKARDITDPEADVLVSVKNAIVGQKEVGDGEITSLKSMGASYVDDLAQ